MKRTGILSIALLVFGCLGAGCGKDKDAETSEPGEASAPVTANEKPVAEKKKRREKKDRGEAAMKIAGIEWKAESAKAKLKGDVLTIKASNTEVNDGNVSRQELQLKMKGYTGPGEYKTEMSGSRFIGVGFDTAAAEAGKADEAATKALSQADHLMLPGAVVKIEAASDSEMSGTFVYEPPKGSNQPTLSEGTFRAVVKK